MTLFPRVNILPAIILVLIPLHVSAQASASDCNGKSYSIDRRAVKLRNPKLARNYHKQSCNIKKWYSLTSYLDPLVPDILDEATPIPKLETEVVILDGWLVAAKWEHHSRKGDGKDEDIHAELSAHPSWTGPHVIIEVPEGKEYCAARKALWDAYEKGQPDTKGILSKPVHVIASGMVFLDYHHASKKNKAKHEYSVSDGGRGIQVKGKSNVRGLWELHPVFAFTSLQ